ncbi:unnamed protein product [Dovyalis caffra]|uniref:Uncharacterized protein n=1 Tax=Dovyalis caffra TaxID=77055 RepID=A0AAV1RZ47_9ROSI|nr:unnamed protein product [Dovyalis caffra]
MAVLLSLSPHHHPLNPPQNPNPKSPKPTSLASTLLNTISKREFIFKATSLCVISLTTQNPLVQVLAESSPPSKSVLSTLANTKSWFQFYGDGFAIRVPPQFEDVMEPEDYSAGMSLYGDKAKPKTFAARFASSDGSEVLSVVVRPSNSLKITFLEAKDITDLGSLKEASKIFVPGGSTLYSARTLKVKEEEGYRTYYFYEFGRDEEHVALVAAVNSGKAIVAGATAPQSKWDNDGVKLRSAAISLTVNQHMGHMGWTHYPTVFPQAMCPDIFWCIKPKGFAPFLSPDRPINPLTLCSKSQQIITNENPTRQQPEGYSCNLSRHFKR